jgi:hypothetical protein
VQKTGRARVQVLKHGVMYIMPVRRRGLGLGNGKDNLERTQLRIQTVPTIETLSARKPQLVWTHLALQQDKQEQLE